VIQRANVTTGQPIGRAHANPLFDTREYVVEFTDGTIENYFTNVVTENMLLQADDEGKQYQLLDKIIDHPSDGMAWTIENGYMVGPNGNHVPKKFSRGRSLLVNWKDGLSDWVNSKDVKDLYPVQVAEYAVTNRIGEEPFYKWWIHDNVLQKRNWGIVFKIMSRCWKTTPKFGIKDPKTVQEALAINEETGTDFWRRAMAKEMDNVKVALRPKDRVTPEQVCTGKVKQVVFDVKMDFTRKARFVAGGHLTEAPESIRYSNVVSRDIICLAFLIAGLDDLDALAGNLTKIST
jgi:hypothetical protein